MTTCVSVIELTVCWNWEDTAIPADHPLTHFYQAHSYGWLSMINDGGAQSRFESWTDSHNISIITAGHLLLVARFLCELLSSYAE